ncbi:MAG: spore germination protein, partial [Syntrophomonadaceae bacterium]|nr:spore germination protein [Syntrophomonadaceae bacterium]
MNFISAIKNILIYQEPQDIEPFELLEDEQEDRGKATSGENNDKAPGSGKGDENDDEKIDETPAAAGLTKPPKRTLSLGEKSKRAKKSGNNNDPDSSQKQSKLVSRELKKNLEIIKQEFNFPLNQDFVIREFKVLQQTYAFIAYIDGMADKTTINDYILRQLMTEQRNDAIKEISIDYISNNLLTVNQLTKESEYNQIIRQVLNGLTVLFVDGNEECIVIESRGYEKRNISTTMTEDVIRGSQEAFVENLRTNLTQVRRIVRNKNLVTEMLPLGKADNQLCAVLYIEGITNPQIVQEVKRRIKSLDIDFILGNGALEQLIEDHPYALFPQILNTERPDRTASFLMDGKVALICDGSPLASIVPIT